MTAITEPNALQSLAMEMPAIANRAALDAAGGKAARQVALQEDEDHDQRQAHHHRRRHQQGPFDVEGGDEHVHDAGRERPRAVRVDQDQRVEILVPADDEGEYGRRDDAWQNLRQHDVEERAEPAGAVDERRPLEILGRAGHERAQEPERIGQGKRRIGDHQAEKRVRDADLHHQEIERQHEDDRRQQIGEQHQQRQPLAAGIREPHETVGAEHAKHEHERRRGTRDHERVPEIFEERCVLEQLSIMLERHAPRPKHRRNREQLLLRLDRGDRHPEQGKYGREDHAPGHDRGNYRFRAAAPRHVCSVPRPTRLKYRTMKVSSTSSMPIA